MADKKKLSKAFPKKKQANVPGKKAMAKGGRQAKGYGKNAGVAKQGKGLGKSKAAVALPARGGGGGG